MTGLETERPTDSAQAFEIVLDPTELESVSAPRLYTLVSLTYAVDRLFDLVIENVRIELYKRIMEPEVDRVVQGMPASVHEQVVAAMHESTFANWATRAAPVDVHVTRMSMASPLVMDVLVTGAASGSVFGTFLYLFKNPDKIGNWFPRLRTAWYEGQKEAEEAKRALDLLRAARAEIREIERGPDITEPGQVPTGDF